MLREFIRRVLQEKINNFHSSTSSASQTQKQGTHIISKHDQACADDDIAPHLRDADSDTPIADEYGPVPPASEPLLVTTDPFTRGAYHNKFH